MEVNASVDQSVPARRRFVPGRVPAVLILLFMATFLIGGTTAVESAVMSSGFVNIITVVAFVGAMLTIAFLMVGDPRRR